MCCTLDKEEPNAKANFPDGAEPSASQASGASAETGASGATWSFAALDKSLTFGDPANVRYSQTMLPVAALSGYAVMLLLNVIYHHYENIMIAFLLSIFAGGVRVFPERSLFLTLLALQVLHSLSLESCCLSVRSRAGPGISSYRDVAI